MQSGALKALEFDRIVEAVCRYAQTPPGLARLREAVAPDEPHRIERAAVGVVSQAVDGDDAGMLEPAGDLGLH